MKTKKYTKKIKDILIFCTLVFFFPFLPVVLFVMWKYIHWSKKAKWITTGVLTALFILGFGGYIFGAPSITVADIKDGKVSVDSDEYLVRGDVSSFNDIASLKINGEAVVVAEDLSFSHEVALNEGDNSIELVATNGNGKTTETITIHRVTQAEIVAANNLNKQRAEQEAAAEAKEKEAAEEKKKASSECNWWCRLTGGSKEDKAKEKAAKEKEAREAVKREAEQEEAEKKAAAERKAAAAKRITDLKSCKIKLDEWTSEEIDSYQDNYGHCGGFDVISACEQWFKSRYPYKGSSMHYLVDLREQGKFADGSKYIKVGVTIQNAFGAKYGATLVCAGKYNDGGTISNTLFSVY